MVVGALGVVFGDIGTSPIYTIQTLFNPADPHHVPVSTANVYCVVSLIFWSLMIIVTVADDHTFRPSIWSFPPQFGDVGVHVQSLIHRDADRRDVRVGDVAADHQRDDDARGGDGAAFGARLHLVLRPYAPVSATSTAMTPTAAIARQEINHRRRERLACFSSADPAGTEPRRATTSR